MLARKGGTLPSLREGGAISPPFVKKACAIFSIVGRRDPVNLVGIRGSKEMLVATLYVYGNEKAYSLQEVHLQSPDYKGFHRYKIIIVNRDGNLAEYREDMGLASKFKGIRQFNVPSLWEHSVEELLDIANMLRTETFIDISDWLELENYKPA